MLAGNLLFICAQFLIENGEMRFLRQMGDWGLVAETAAGPKAVV
jgi:hypothetical protein